MIQLKSQRYLELANAWIENNKDLDLTGEAANFALELKNGVEVLEGLGVDNIDHITLGLTHMAYLLEIGKEEAMKAKAEMDAQMQKQKEEKPEIKVVEPKKKKAKK